MASLGDSDQIRVGGWDLATGNPMGSTLMFSVTTGIVSTTDRSMGLGSVEEFIQTDAVANSGNSGGPLVDLHGRIIGMNSVIASRSGYYQGYTLAIPDNLILPVVSKLIERGHVTRGVLGATTPLASPSPSRRSVASWCRTRGTRTVWRTAPDSDWAT